LFDRQWLSVGQHSARATATTIVGATTPAARHHKIVSKKSQPDSPTRYVIAASDDISATGAVEDQCLRRHGHNGQDREQNRVTHAKTRQWGATKHLHNFKQNDSAGMVQQQGGACLAAERKSPSAAQDAPSARFARQLHSGHLSS